MQHLGDFHIDDYVAFGVQLHRFSSGAVYAPTGDVTYTFYENNSTSGAPTGGNLAQLNSKTGLYSARVQLTSVAGFEVDKQYFIHVEATVDGVAAGELFMFRIIPSISQVQLADGVAHGGSAASLTLGAGAAISSSTGDALTITSTASGGHAVKCVADTAGNAAGIRLEGKYGIYADVTNCGVCIDSNATGMDISGGSSHGIMVTGGGSHGLHVRSIGGNGHGLFADGHGTGHGLYAESGASGCAIAAWGSMAGIHASCAADIATGQVEAGISAVGYATNDRAGIAAFGGGAGAGASLTGGATGVGMSVVGGSTSGDGISITTTSGALIDADAVAEIADGVLDEVFEDTMTVRQVLRAMLSVIANKSAGGGTPTVTFRDKADSKNRITATVDTNGNRSAVTLDLD